MQLGKRLPGAEIRSLDIGGRDDFGQGGSIIGGGQLLMDVELYFPYRIATAVLQSRRHTPLFVYGVGVSSSWSRRGLRLLNEVFAHGRLTYAAVRDRQSQRHWSRNFVEDAPGLTRDPALLAPQRYGGFPKTSTRSGRKTIALGVSNPGDLRQHAEEPAEMVCGSEPFYLELIEQLARLDFDISLFTNGNDHGYLERVAARLDELSPRARPHVTILPRARRPDELIAQIARADALIVHRLHANIIAYAYGIPHIGLAWDKKLQDFFESVDRLDYLVRSVDSDADAVIEKLQKTLAEGIDTTAHARAIAETEDGIDLLAERLANAVNGRLHEARPQAMPAAW